MRWFEQHKNFQLGDFIMLTSGLKALSEIWGSPINVFFNTSIVRDLYFDCDFINIIHKRPSTKCFSSSIFSSYNHGDYRKKRLNKKESMQRCFFRCMMEGRKYKGEMPHTYVDSPNGKKLNKVDGKKCIAVFHGCLGDLFVTKKSIPPQSLSFLVSEILRMGYIPVILGSKKDNVRYWNKIKLKDDRIINYVNKLSIRDSVSILSQCDNFISNDTGLYHVSSALRKNGLVLWNNTDFHKNDSSHPGIKMFYGKGKTFEAYNTAISDYLGEIL